MGAQNWAFLVPLDSSFRDASNGILYDILRNCFELFIANISVLKLFLTVFNCF